MNKQLKAYVLSLITPLRNKLTSIDASDINGTLFDAKGDILTASAADTPARQAVGTNGQVLTAQSGQTNGLLWATLVKGDVGLGNVDNTSDANKPVSTAQQAALDAKQNKAWTIVESASASVSPTAADSGKFYRLSHAAPTFNLPTTSLVAGETYFYVQFAGGAGTIHPGANVIEGLVFDSGAFAGESVSPAPNIFQYQYVEVRFIKTGVWARTGIRTL